MGLELERLVAEASVLAGGIHPCHILGHRWTFAGGRNCGCDDDACCSVPVHRCDECGDYDYGDNEDAANIRLECDIANPPPLGDGYRVAKDEALQNKGKTNADR